MNYLIIGSVAMYHWFPDARRPKDIDLLTPAKISGNHGDVCVVDAQWHEAAEKIMAINKDPVFADPDVLYTIKVSHAYWNIHHDKTLFDINFLKNKGAVLNMELHDALLPVWTRIHGAQTRVAINKPMAEFFSDAVVREYDHEWLHEQVAFYERPIHERIRPDMSNVRCSQEMFEALSFDDQCLCAIEEIMTTAIERARLRASSKKSEKLAAMKLAHRKLCTTMAKGWFARFNIIHNFELLITRRTQWLTQLDSTLACLPPPMLVNSSTPSSKRLMAASHAAKFTKSKS